MTQTARRSAVGAALDTETPGLWFEEGLIGVPRARRFELLERTGSPLRVLRSLDVAGFALPVVDPGLADPTYEPLISPRVTSALELDAGCKRLLLAVVTLERELPVANLRAPLVINLTRGLGAQVILDNRRLPLCAPLGPGLERL